MDTESLARIGRSICTTGRPSAATTPRTLASLPELPEAIPGNHRKVYAWLREHGVINMETKLDIELGVPIANAVVANGCVSADALPAGRYASVVYTGPYAGDGLMRANAALLDWAAEPGPGMGPL
jgi:effector-binding domain-containing protein